MGTTLAPSIITALLLAMAVGAGTVKAMSPPPPLSTPVVIDGNSIGVWVDPGNGCQYLTRQGAITPRLHTDGIQVCNGPDLLGHTFDEYGEDPTGDYDAGDDSFDGSNFTAEQFELLPEAVGAPLVTPVSTRIWL